MLTAHSLDRESLKKSGEEGAAYFVPKAEIGKIDVFVADVIEARDKKKNPWVKWFERLGAFFDTKTNFTVAMAGAGPMTASVTTSSGSEDPRMASIWEMT